MSWKPKEKELTLEEAVELARQELAPFWFKSSPQIAGIRTESGYTVVPLESDFSKKSWLTFFIDSTSFSGETALFYAKEWHRRYSPQQLGTLLMLSSDYSFIKDRELMQAFVDRHQIQFPVAVDSEETLFPAFQANKLPKVVLIHQGKPYFEYSGEDKYQTIELEVQSFLRDQDPGLPLLPVLQLQKGLSRDTGRYEFGFQCKSDVAYPFPEPGFSGPSQGIREAIFHGTRLKSPKAGEVFISGSWMQDGEKIATSDPNAYLGIYLSSPRLSFLAQSLSKTTDQPIVSVEVDGMPVYESIAGANLVMDSTGLSVAEVVKPQVYHLLANAPQEKVHEVIIRFPNADLAPIGIYSLRTGS